MNFNKSKEFKTIFRFDPIIRGRILSRESSFLEFKESFNWLSRDRYAKSIAAFANNKGGFIVFGIKDQPRDIIGLHNNSFNSTDEGKITNYLNSRFSPAIELDKFAIKVKRKDIGIVYIHQSNNKPVVCIKQDGDIKEAEIYYRYNGTSEKIKYPEFKNMLAEMVSKERSNWMSLLEKIAVVGPSNAAILDIISGRISGRKGTLIIDHKLVPKLRFIKEGMLKKKGQPVLKLVGDVTPISFTSKGSATSMKQFTVSDDANASMIRIQEEDVYKKIYPLSYSELTDLLLKRYSDFIRNQKYHSLRRMIMKDPSLHRIRYLNPRNPKSVSQDFYSPLILREFDKHYKRKR